MLSGKQRRAEIKAARLNRKAKRKHALATTLSPASDAFADARYCVPVDTSKLAPNVSYDTPEFVRRGYYLDVAFTCVDCGAPGVWTVKRQKWWYETAHGDVWSKANRCPECRAKKRAQRELGRKTWFEGLARKAAKRQG